MAESDVQQVWRYEPRNRDPPESHAAWKDILEDEDVLTELDISDDHENGQVRILVHQTADPELFVYDGTDTGVTVDFTKSLIQLKKAQADIVKMEEAIPAKQVRHCSLPWLGVNGQRNDGRLIRVSTWDENRAVCNLNLVADDAKTALILMNAVNRLIYETSEKSKPRTTQFHVIREGTINMAMTSAAERDQRDEIKLKQHLKKAEQDVVGEGSKSSADDESVESLPALKDSEFYFILDEEALCVYDHFASVNATHDFRFYREPTAKSVETIYSCHDEDQLELQHGENVFYLHPASTQQPDNVFQDLVNYLKAGHLRPKPEMVFKAVAEFNRFYSPAFERDVLRPPMTLSPSPADQKPPPEPEDLDAETSLPPVDPAMFRLPFPSGTQPMKTDVPFPTGAIQQADAGAAAAAARPRDWLDQLNTGSHLLSVSEDMQMTWFGVEHELNQMISGGLIPTYNIDSAGLDPQSPEHLQKLIEEIKDEMLKQNYGVALSYLRECMKVYGTTLLRQLAACNELDSMKRIYFLSG